MRASRADASSVYFPAIDMSLFANSTRTICCCFFLFPRRLFNTHVRVGRRNEFRSCIIRSFPRRWKKDGDSPEAYLSPYIRVLAVNYQRQKRRYTERVEVGSRLRVNFAVYDELCNARPRLSPPLSRLKPGQYSCPIIRVISPAQGERERESEEEEAALPRARFIKH